MKFLAQMNWISTFTKSFYARKTQKIISKVLILRLGSLGDVVLTTPVINLLKEAYPKAEIDFLVKNEFSEILAGNPNLNKAIPFDSKGTNKGLSGLIGIVRELKKNQYSHVIDLHGNLRSRVISSLLISSSTLRYNKQAIKRRLLLSGIRLRTIHTTRSYAKALLPLNINKDPGIPQIFFSTGESEGANKYLQREGIKNGSLLIGFNPGAKWPTKMWPAEHFVELGKRLIKELKGKVLIFGGPDEVDICSFIKDGIGDDAILLAGKKTLKESAALIRKCNLFVSNDSGPMHMASAVDTPVIAFFGPTVQDFGFSPLGKSVVLEKPMKCRPCSLHGSDSCPEGHFKCLKEINPEEVFEKARELLQR